MKFKAALFSIALASPAIAGDMSDRPHGPWYIGASAGALMAMDAVSTVSGSEATLSAEPGYALAGAIGYRWPKNIRTEFELSYGSFTVDEYRYRNVTYQVDGLVHRIAMSVNAFYDLKNDSKFTPYGGAGIGIVHSLMTDRISVTGTKLDDAYSTNPKIMGELGVAYSAPRGITVGPSYRVEHIFSGTTDDENYTDHLFKLNVTVPLKVFR